jgi:hypothetical protein
MQYSTPGPPFKPLYGLEEGSDVANASHCLNIKKNNKGHHPPQSGPPSSMSRSDVEEGLCGGGEFSSFARQRHSFIAFFLREAPQRCAEGGSALSKDKIFDFFPKRGCIFLERCYY